MGGNGKGVQRAAPADHHTHEHNSIPQLYHYEPNQPTLTTYRRTGSSVGNSHFEGDRLQQNPFLNFFDITDFCLRIRYYSIRNFLAHTLIII